MKSIAVILLVGFAASLGSCATPVAYTTSPMTEYDQHTSYAVEDFDGGFTITVYYSRYQFIPESDAVNMAAESQLLALAYEIAASRDREIRQINEQTIKKSMGRNGVSGITSWSGTVKAYYKD
ncbi:MAG: hypothetical protein CMJ39_05795 [Phycisphaerae bacterium]|nr:hypothetical protein [Phycisphaerae bacterium]